MIREVFSMKKQKRVQQKLGFWQSLSSTVTNLKYNVQKNFNQIKQKYLPEQQDSEHKRIVIQGKTYPNRSEAKKAVKQILWFSYRKGFNIKDKYKSDVGWGCLIRVGQMALASALLKYFQSQKPMQINSKDNQKQTLIYAFSDIQGEQQKYSLNRIIQIAQRYFSQEPGQWFDLSKISHSLRVIQNKFPMRGAQNLQIVFMDQSINIPTILKVLSIKVCSCAKIKIVCHKCHSQLRPIKKEKVSLKDQSGRFQTLDSQVMVNDYGMKKKKNYFMEEPTNNNWLDSRRVEQNLQTFRHKRLNRDLFVLLLTRVADPIGIQKVNKAIFTLLDLKFCLGIMTGFPRQAIFVVGRQNDRLIYLNPHYVQDNAGFDSCEKQTYFCQEYLLTERTRLDPSMVFCFHIQNLSELQELTGTVSKITQNFRDSLSIGIDCFQQQFDMNDYLEQQQDSMSVQSSFKL